jgi:hypothetical protein
MLRCLLLALAIATAGAAQAQLRSIPADAKRGTLSHVQGMTMELNGARIDLSAGAQIRDGRNMIVVPTAVPRGILVKYQLSTDKKLDRVWILSPQEAAQPDLAR